MILAVIVGGVISSLFGAMWAEPKTKRRKSSGIKAPRRRGMFGRL
jgi:hypothetical protein